MAFGTARLNVHGLSPRVDPAFEILAPLGVGSVPAQPVLGARQFPGGVEVARVGRDGGAPDIRRPPRARQVGPIRVQPIGLARTRVARRVGRLSRQDRDIE